jgi:formate dehydrogenase major subunit
VREVAAVGFRDRLDEWPVVRQIKGRDLSGLIVETAGSKRTRQGLHARTRDADDVKRSVCPYCAVGCGQLLYTEDDRLIDIEGDPASPVSRGKLCPKGAATFQLVTGAHRTESVLYRRPGGTDWEEVDYGWAMDRVAELTKQTRDRTWEDTDGDGNRLNRTLGFAHLGGATLDNEENYLIKKLFTALGAIQIENQARI